MLAAHKGRKGITRQLLQSGADIDDANKLGETSLMLAAANGHAETVELLLQAGADTRIRNNRRERVRDIAATAGQAEILLLIDRHEDNKGWLKNLR